MLIFGHIGITLAAMLFVNQILKFNRRGITSARRVPENDINRSTHSKYRIQSIYLVDIIACTVGSILPDLIDKPIGNIFLVQTFANNGRIFAHTFLFAFAILGLGLYLYISRKRTWGLALFFGVFMHLILDYMWQSPQALFWPLFGWSFPPSADYNWLAEIWHDAFNDPAAYIPEFLGIFLIVLIIWILIRKRYIIVSPD